MSACGPFALDGAEALALGPDGRPVAPGALALERRVEARDDHVVIDLSARNVSDRPIPLSALVPLALSRPLASALRVGYSNPIPPVFLGPRDREDRAITHPAILRLMPAAGSARPTPSARS